MPEIPLLWVYVVITLAMCIVLALDLINSKYLLPYPHIVIERTFWMARIKHVYIEWVYGRKAYSWSCKYLLTLFKWNYDENLEYCNKCKKHLGKYCGLPDCPRCGPTSTKCRSARSWNIYWDDWKDGVAPV
jgi:hypothetical protein